MKLTEAEMTARIEQRAAEVDEAVRQKYAHCIEATDRAAGQKPSAVARPALWPATWPVRVDQDDTMHDEHDAENDPDRLSPVVGAMLLGAAVAAAAFAAVAAVLWYGLAK